VESEELRRRRTRRMRRILKFLPRRSHLLRLPFVGKLFAKRNRSRFLWSFQAREVIPAFLIGWVITLSPFFGIHTLLIVLSAFLFRANLLIALLLQVLSIPPIFPGILVLTYLTGNYAVQHLGGATALRALDEAHIDMETLKNIFSAHGNFVELLSDVAHAIATMTLGALLLGFVCAGISILIFLTFFGKKKH
jgi:uncharacterized protein (DUF2062 family)